MDNPWKIVSIVAIILLAVSVLLGIAGAYDSAAGTSLFTKGGNTADVAQKAVSFINANLLSEGYSASLVNVTEVSGMYRLNIRVNSTGGQRNLVVFQSKDGALLFPTYYNMTASRKQTASASNVNATALLAQACAAAGKQDEPEIQAFVVSYCPYGIQMQGVLVSLIQQVPSVKKNIRVLYIGQVTNGTVYSMHGATEAAENLRQVCIREEQSDRYWDYVSCFITSRSSDACVKSAGVDAARLTTCTGESSRGLRYIAQDFALGDAAGVSASPTLILNNKKVSEASFGGRNAESIRTMLCCGDTANASWCNKKLNTTRQVVASGQC